LGSHTIIKLKEKSKWELQWIGDYLFLGRRLILFLSLTRTRILLLPKLKVVNAKEKPKRNLKET
jgi:hypothetical protein